MATNTPASYEIVFRNGASILIENVTINLEFQNRKISKFNVIGNGTTGDEPKFINIGEIIAVNKKGKRRLWKR